MIDIFRIVIMVASATAAGYLIGHDGNPWLAGGFAALAVAAIAAGVVLRERAGSRYFPSGTHFHFITPDGKPLPGGEVVRYVVGVDHASGPDQSKVLCYRCGRAEMEREMMTSLDDAVVTTERLLEMMKAALGDDDIRFIAEPAQGDCIPLLGGKIQYKYVGNGLFARQATNPEWMANTKASAKPLDVNEICKLIKNKAQENTTP